MSKEDVFFFLKVGLKQTYTYNQKAPVEISGTHIEERGICQMYMDSMYLRKYGKKKQVV